MRGNILPSCITCPPNERGERGFPRKLDLRQIPFSPAASNPWFTLQILRCKPIARFLRDLHSSADKRHCVILCRKADISWGWFCFVVHPMPWANCDGSCDYLKGFNRSDYSIKCWPLGSRSVLTVSWRNAQPTLILIVQWPYHYFQGAFVCYQ